MLWLQPGGPGAKAALGHLKPTALAVHRSGAAVIGGYADGAPRTDSPCNLLVVQPGVAAPLWSRPVFRDVGEAQPPEPGAYGRPRLEDGSCPTLAQRDEPLFAPLSIAVTREAEFSASATRFATADYPGWRRWVCSSASGQDENYGARFVPARPVVTVYDGAGQLLRRFGPERFARSRTRAASGCPGCPGR
jgi:hypothetical protein